MDTFILPLLVILLFDLTLASLLNLRATPGSPCAPICDHAVQDGAFTCKDGVFEGAELEECFECLQRGEYMDGEREEYLATLLGALEAACPERRLLRSLQKPHPSINRRATPQPLPKGAIAGIALGAALILALAASLAYLAHRKYSRRTTSTPARSWKGPRRTTSSLDFRCRTRVTPMASRADFRRLSKEGEKGVLPGDALGSNPVLGRTLEEVGTSPNTGTESSWNGQTLCSAQSPPATSIKWASPAVPQPRTPTPAYSPHRSSPYTLPSATPSSTRSEAPLLPARIYTPPEYGSVSPSSYRSGESGPGVLYPPGKIWDGPARALRTRRGGWDLYSRSMEEGTARGARVEEVEGTRKYGSGTREHGGYGGI